MKKINPNTYQGERTVTLHDVVEFYRQNSKLLFSRDAQTQLYIKQLIKEHK